MRLSAILCASVVGLAAMALTAEAASKASSVKIDGSDASVKACTDKGGVVSTGATGQMTCTKPAAGCAASTATASEASSIDINDALAVKTCFEACGTIATDPAGHSTCTKPTTAPPPPPPPPPPPAPASAPAETMATPAPSAPAPREPHN